MCAGLFWFCFFWCCTTRRRPELSHIAEIIPFLIQLHTMHTQLTHTFLFYIANICIYRCVWNRVQSKGFKQSWKICGTEKSSCRINRRWCANVNIKRNCFAETNGCILTSKYCQVSLMLRSEKEVLFYLVFQLKMTWRSIESLHIFNLYYFWL